MNATKKLQSIAYHEAGHAVMAWWHGLAIRKATIVPHKDYLGSVTHFKKLLPTDETDLRPSQRDLLERRIMVLLSGPEAERKFRGHYSHKGSGHDRHYAFDHLASLTGPSEDELNTYMKLLWLRTRRILDFAPVWACVTAVANALLEKRSLTGSEIKALIAEREGLTGKEPD
ncbi:MAG: hypothetical protein ACE15E_00575 [Acidobacteriota bacterium]